MNGLSRFIYVCVYMCVYMCVSVYTVKKEKVIDLEGIMGGIGRRRGRGGIGI